MRIGTLVWQRWRNDWYMARVREAETLLALARRDDGDADADAGSDTEAPPRRVKIHVQGEPETRDKWYDADSVNLVPLVEIDAADTAVGVFPQVGDTVELLVMDAALHESLVGREEDPVLLLGVVQRVVPGRDASIVQVDYPPNYGSVENAQRRVCVGNGYLRVLRDPDATASTRSRLRVALSPKHPGDHPT